MLALTGRGRACAKWIKHPHAPKAGLQAAGALHAVKLRRTLPAASPPSSRSCARRRRTRATRSARPSKLFDNYYLPAKLTVNKGSTITWKWPSDMPIDVHDVKLKSGPEGVRKFQSEPASSGYRYKRTLKKPGTYKIVCTLHEEMKMTIRVRRG